jgi:hypothetical protein
VADVGAEPQDGEGVIDATLLGEQISQPPGGVPVAGVGADPKLIDATLLGKQISQSRDGVPVAGVGADPQVFGVDFAGEVVLEEGVPELPGGSGLAQRSPAVGVVEESP